jgi:hypothetical protein
VLEGNHPGLDANRPIEDAMYSLSGEGPKCSTESSIPDQSKFINPIAGVEATKPAVKSWASIAATKGG